MNSTFEDQVVFELSDDVKNYVTDFGIANGVTARFSYQTSPDLKLAIPFELFQAQAVSLLLQDQWPLKHFWISPKSEAAA